MFSSYFNRGSSFASSASSNANDYDMKVNSNKNNNNINHNHNPISNSSGYSVKPSSIVGDLSITLPLLTLKRAGDSYSNNITQICSPTNDLFSNPVNSNHSTNTTVPDVRRISYSLAEELHHSNETSKNNTFNSKGQLQLICQKSSQNYGSQEDHHNVHDQTNLTLRDTGDVMLRDITATFNNLSNIFNNCSYSSLPSPNLQDLPDFTIPDEFIGRSYTYSINNENVNSANESKISRDLSAAFKTFVQDTELPNDNANAVKNREACISCVNSHMRCENHIPRAKVISIDGRIFNTCTQCALRNKPCCYAKKHSKPGPKRNIIDDTNLKSKRVKV